MTPYLRGYGREQVQYFHGDGERNSGWLWKRGLRSGPGDTLQLCQKQWQMGRKGEEVETETDSTVGKDKWKDNEEVRDTDEEIEEFVTSMWARPLQGRQWINDEPDEGAEGGETRAVSEDIRR